MSSDFSESYESVLIKDKIWFVCKYDDCHDIESEEQNIISHIEEKHMNPHNHRSDEQQMTADNHSDEDICQSIEADIKPKIEIIPLEPTVQTSNEEEELYLSAGQTHNRFKCQVTGCGKSFLYLKSLLEHKNSHKTNKQIISKNAAKSQMRSQFIPETKVQIKSTAIHNYNHIKDKYLRVQRLNDRSIHRWQKQDHRLDANYRGMQSLKNLGAYYRKDIIDGQKLYLCGYNQSCQFRTNRTQHMARHLNCCHLRTRIFRCSISGCDRKYYNPTSLRQHTLNHKCGFGILNGKTMVTVCGNKSINRYRKSIIENDIKQYKCAFLDCPFKTKSHSCIKRHIHDQHLCPNRIKYLDQQIVSQFMPTELLSQQNSPLTERNVKTSNIEIPEMIEISAIRRQSPVKRRAQNNIQNIPMMSEMPNINCIPEIMEIPITPDLIDYKDMPKLKRQTKHEVREHPNSYSVNDVIDQLIRDENCTDNRNNSRKQMNLTNNQQFVTIDDNNESDDEDIQILDQIIVEKREASQEFQTLIETKNVTLDYDINTYNKLKNELSRLHRCRPHFDLTNDPKTGVRYVCKFVSCQFPAKSLEAISMHLRIKHFIDN